MSIKQWVRSLCDERWNIGFIQNNMESILDGDELSVKWLKHDYKDRWFADPFILEETETEIIVLVEEYYKPIKRGRISRLTIDKNDFSLLNLEVILELDTHLSFPAYERIGSEFIYLYPENTASGQLKRYKYFPRDNRIEFDSVIVNAPLADAIISSIGDSKYLCATSLPSRNGNKLEIYKQGHDGYQPLQTIKFNENIARMSGNFFEYNGNLYRPTQECNVQYGHAVTLQEVKIVNNHFDFKEIQRLYSPHPQLNIGLHTFNVYKNIIVTDALGFDRMWLRRILMSFGIIPKR